MKNRAIEYARQVCKGKINAPEYVKKQCKEFLVVASDKNEKYMINETILKTVESLTKIFFMHKGYCRGKSVYESLVGFQCLFIVSVLCIVDRENKNKRRYTNAVLEICRKNGKTFLIAVIFLILFFIEPKFSKFYSVAPNGELSREVKDTMSEIIASSPALNNKYKGKDKFKDIKTETTCNITRNTYKPLNCAYGRLDGRLPTVFLADEVGALSNGYPLEAMRSGQLTIENKLGCVISTKYPSFTNPFEDEVDYCKKVLDGIIEDDETFSLLYEPDNSADWMDDDGIIEQGNPLAVEYEELMDNIMKKRARAIEMPSTRENFLCKHCNIIYQGMGTENYIDVGELLECRTEKINWQGREVYLGVDLAMTTDNCSVAMVSWDEEKQKTLAQAVVFIPEDRISEKNVAEKINYNDFIEEGSCIACGGRTVDYSVIENYVLSIEEKYGVKVMGIGFDRYNCLSSAQKWEDAGLITCEVKQHSSVLHPATKWLSELITNGNFEYEKCKLYEINFENAKCVYDTNLNRYVNKKKSNGKVDMVVATINAMFMLHQAVMFDSLDWAIQY